MATVVLKKRRLDYYRGNTTPLSYYRIGSSGPRIASRCGWQSVPSRVVIEHASVAITGTATATIDEDDVVAGSKTIIITLTGDTWVASGANFNAQRQNIINGLDSAQSEGTGWNAEVRDKEVVTAVVRTDDFICTITLTAAGSYDITATETITVTVPNTALLAGILDLTGDVPFTVDAVGVLANPKGPLGHPLVGALGGPV